MPFLFFGVCSVSFVCFLESFFLRVAFWDPFLGANFLFLLSYVGLLFFSGVLPMFLLYVTAFRSWTCFSKILLVSGLLVWVRFLFRTGFVTTPFVSVWFCLFKRESSG